MFCAYSRPQSLEPMVRVRERPTAADGDEARVANFREDHAASFMNTDLDIPYLYYIASDHSASLAFSVLMLDFAGYISCQHPAGTGRSLEQMSILILG